VQGFYNVLHISQRHFFCFDWRGIRYQFRALLMGCSESPRIFSKVVRAFVYRARALGINVFSYLDDTLTFDLSYEVTKAKPYKFADLLTQVGFLLHKEKSVREPTQRILFLGFIIDSTSMTLKVPHEKFLAIQDLIQSALKVVDEQAFMSLRFLAKVVGKLILVCLTVYEFCHMQTAGSHIIFYFHFQLLPATRYGKAHYRALERMLVTTNWQFIVTILMRKCSGLVLADPTWSGGLTSLTPFPYPSSHPSSPFI
jgi:hypothetical protein